MDNSDGTFSMGKEPRGYAITGKIMLSAIVVLFGIVVFMVVLHLYARWYITRVRHGDRIRRRNRANRRTQIVFYVDNHVLGSGGVQNRGLEKEVLNSLPVFVYSSEKPDRVSECAVCLSEFEDGEKFRVLPKCNHSFHIECIDMWFHTRSTCPLCRSAVEPVQQLEHNQSRLEMGGREPMKAQSEPGPSSGSFVNENASAHLMGNGFRSIVNKENESGRKRFDFSGVRIDIPSRNELENDLSPSSPASQSFRSPGSRLSSIKRMLSMNKKSPVGTGTSCSDSVNCEFDLETGLTPGQSRQLN